MAARRLSMRKVRALLRRRWDNKWSIRKVAQSCGVSVGAALSCENRAKAAGLTWPLPEDLDDAALEALLYRDVRQDQRRDRPLPDMVELHKELKRKGVTLQLLWHEYKQEHPEGYQYTQFCHHYQRWAQKLDACMRQEHRAGEKTFIDYSGDGMPLVDPKTGEVSEAQLYVAVLGASSYTYAEATRTQRKPDWIASNIRMFEFFGGVTDILVPDCLKSGVTQPCRYEPLVNRTYYDMADHYDSCVIPARPRKPRDKAKVEVGVLVAQRWIVAKLRKRTFFSLNEMNEAIRQCVDELNTREMKHLKASRRQLYEELDRPALKPLPTRRYAFAEFKKVRVNIDYHVELEHHYYSVPYQLLRKELEARYTATTVELFYKGRRVAAHIRSYAWGKATTLEEHMPAAHRAHMNWTPSRMIRWATKAVGTSTGDLVKQIMESKRHPEQGYRACLGIIRLEKRYSAPRLEAACRRALKAQTHTYRSVKSILETGLDREPLDDDSERASRLGPSTVTDHDNIRGTDYYE